MVEKYTLPCFNFVATGCCNYYERCIYIHDPRISGCNKLNVKNVRSPNSFSSQQTLFYWTPSKNKEQHNIKLYNTNDKTTINIWNRFLKDMEKIN